MDLIIEVKDVSYRYPGTEAEDKKRNALTDINLSIRRGEFVGIIGHNGSGKSTLSKLLNAIIIPTKGDILINGMNTKDPQNLWKVRQSAGMVFQNPDNQLVATVVEEDIAFGPENLGVPTEEIWERIDQALKAVGMTEYRKKKPHLLSGGQKQRVAIAGILAMQPECIIFDEPTAMLDPAGRKEVMNTIKRLNRDKNMTVLHITHYMGELVDADRIIVLDKGQVLLEGTPEEVFTRVDLLKSKGLDVPAMTELAHRLSRKGYSVPQNILHIKDMVTTLCQFKSSI